MLSFLLGIYLRVELLNHMITLCLVFWGTTKLFSLQFTLTRRHLVLPWVCDRDPHGEVDWGYLGDGDYRLPSSAIPTLPWHWWGSDVFWWSEPRAARCLVLGELHCGWKVAMETNSFLSIGIRTGGLGVESRGLIGKAERWLTLRLKLSETLTRFMEWPRSSRGGQESKWADEQTQPAAALKPDLVWVQISVLLLASLDNELNLLQVEF